MTPEFASRSLRIIRSSIIIFSMVVGMSISTNAETVKVMDKASTDGSFTIAQTNGMDRRGDRRDTRQDCRQQEGVVGADKRNCKQNARQIPPNRRTHRSNKCEASEMQIMRHYFQAGHSVNLLNIEIRDRRSA